MIMKNNMKLILERWDRYVLLENAALEKLKQDENAAKNLLDKVTKTSNDKELENFSKIVLSDPEVKEASEKLLQFLQILKKEAEQQKPSEMEEGLLDDVGIAAYSMAQKFANSELGSIIQEYGPGTLILASAVLLASNNIDIETAMNTVGLGVALKAKDSKEIGTQMAEIASSLL